MRKLLALSVHIFTATGIVSGFYAIVAIANGNLKMAMWLLFLCQFIDGIDGTFARLFKVKEVLPNMDGKTIDYVIDFATYAIIPAYMIYASGILPEEAKDLTVSAILLVSAIYYGLSGMVSEDNHFVGFPVMWNFAAFYLVFVTHCTPWVNVVLIAILCILHFVPIKFAYPSRSTQFFIPHLVNTLACVGSALAILWFYPNSVDWLNIIALFTIIYYLGMGIYETWIKK